MKILSLVNVSNPENLDCDSGMIYQRIVGEEMARRGVDYVLAGPDSNSFRSIEIAGVTKRYLPLGGTRYEARLHFPWPEFDRLLRQDKPDIIFCNQIEHTAPVAGLLESVGASSTPIASYCHYPIITELDEGTLQFDPSFGHRGLGQHLVYRVSEATCIAGLVLVQSRFAARLLECAVRHCGLDTKCQVKVIPPPLDPAIAKEKIVVENATNTSHQVKICFNHRLYPEYGAGHFLELVTRLKGSQYQFVVFDPMSSRSKQREHLHSAPAEFRRKLAQIENVTFADTSAGRASYAQGIGNCSIAVGAHRKSCVWSMSVVDNQSLGVPVIAPRMAAYPEMVPDSLLYDDTDHAVNLLNRLSSDTCLYNSASHDSKRMTERLHANAVVQELLDSFEELLGDSKPKRHT